MKTPHPKSLILSRHFQNADEILNSSEEEVIFRFTASPWLFEFETINTSVKMSYTEAEVNAAECDGNEIVINGDSYLPLKVSAITPPIEMLNFDSLFDIFDEVANKFDSRVYEGYSGRAMYGKECWGIVTDTPDEVIAEMNNRGFKNARRDSLGLQSIVYWPNIEYSDPAPDI